MQVKEVNLVPLIKRGQVVEDLRSHYPPPSCHPQHDLLAMPQPRGPEDYKICSRIGKFQARMKPSSWIEHFIPQGATQICVNSKGARSHCLKWGE